jgi:hypothetical protein
MATEITAGVGREENAPAKVITWIIVDDVAQPAHLMEPLEARLFASLLVAMADKAEYENATTKQGNDEEAEQRRRQFKVIQGGG